jgi:hypothetical protein
MKSLGPKNFAIVTMQHIRDKHVKFASLPVSAKRDGH